MFVSVDQEKDQALSNTGHKVMNDDLATNTGQVNEMSGDSLDVQSLAKVGSEGVNHLEDVENNAAATSSDGTIHMHVKYCIG